MSNESKLRQRGRVSDQAAKVVVVIPAYNVKAHILSVIEGVSQYCEVIYVVDDCCPQKTGRFVLEHYANDKIRVLFHENNLGVGGAVMTGYRQAILDGATIIVKVDGDGQMDPALIPEFVEPILRGEADYTKGNRFYDLRAISAMPSIRIIGNAGLSFLAKLSTGYWNIFDPTNGYTAIHADVAGRLPLDNISNRFFFETDMLFRLNTFRAVVVDIPMNAKYEDEKSNLSIRKIFFEFLLKHLRNFIKRIFYTYFLRDFSIASLELIFGLVLVCFGASFGLSHWVESARFAQATPVGTIMLSVTAAITGLQLLLAFLGHDIQAIPTRCLHLRWYRSVQQRKGDATSGGSD